MSIVLPQIIVSVAVALAFKMRSIKANEMPVFSQSQKSQERGISFRYCKGLLAKEMRYWLKRRAADSPPARSSKLLSLKKRNKMNFGLTPLCLKLLCDNDSLLPTHTPAPRAGTMVSKPNTRVAGETHSRWDSSSLYQYMKYIWGTLATLRAHSLAELMLFEHRGRHQWHSSLEHWYSTSSSFPGWQMEIPGSEICETALNLWYLHSDYSVENMPKASLLWITTKCSIRGWIYRKPAASKDSPLSSVSQRPEESTQINR